MRTRRPLSINNSLVHGICNLNCVTCSINKESYTGPKAYQSLEVTQALIARVREAGAQGVYVRYLGNSGDGEPTLHPELPQVLGLFGELVRGWEASVPAPELGLVTNGTMLCRPGILPAIADNGLTLTISFPTSDPEAYGEIMAGRPDQGERLLRKVVPGIEQALAYLGAGRLRRLLIHLSPPVRNLVRRDFLKTVNFLTSRASERGVKRLELVIFPTTSNRSGLISHAVSGTDMGSDLKRLYHGQAFHGVRLELSLMMHRFFHNTAEIITVLRDFQFPCLWNANLFITPDGTSICCNDQAVRSPLGNLHQDSIAQLMERREDYRSGLACVGCDQAPHLLQGTVPAKAYAMAAQLRMSLGGLSRGAMEV